MKIPKSPLAPTAFPALPRIDGVSFFTAQAGVKYKNRDDVLLASLTPGTKVAGVFTQSSVPGAPIQWSRKTLKDYKTRKPIGILVNTGNANVFTGKAGKKTVTATVKSAAKWLKTPACNIFTASTGVIGEPLEPAPICKVLDTGALTPSDWPGAANAIRTTDTFAKGAGQSVMLDGETINFSGIVKGSGMIAPDMATMLGFVFTNAKIDKRLLQKWLQQICATTFNAITVDSDTSTSDMVLLAATATAKMEPVKSDKDPRAIKLKAALSEVMLALSHLVIKDGEGARKFIGVEIQGAASQKEAKILAMSIANSPLVKTAIAGEDANWGRIIMAIGKSGARANRDKLLIHFGPYLVAQNGMRAVNYDEAILSEYMKNDTINLHIDVGVGKASFCAWTCDLTHGYIDINADYRS